MSSSRTEPVRGIARRWSALVLCLPWFLACATLAPARPPATAAPSDERGTAQLDAFTIPPLPDWADRYANSDPKTDVRFFRIPKLMQTFGLTRFQAAEVQNYYRHLTTTGMPAPQAFQQSVAEVKAGNTLSRVHIEKLHSAKFIIVFDLDETLYQAFYKSGSRGPAWRDFVFDSRGQEAQIKLRPGWLDAISRIHQLGGLVLLFTARSDDVAESAARSWTVGSGTIRDVVDGFLSKGHMIMQEKADGEPISTPSKDLRLFDEALERVILIDDNPRRVVQHHRQRLLKKFQADPYLADKLGPNNNTELTRSFERTLPSIVHELEESLAYMAAHSGTSFARAYLPYTMLGQVAVEALQQAGLNNAAAREYIRQHPDYVDDAF